MHAVRYLFEKSKILNDQYRQWLSVVNIDII
jgi:hypothetical protein